MTAKKECRIKPTKQEIAFAKKLRRVIDEMPETCCLVADGSLVLVDRKAYESGDFEPHTSEYASIQPLSLPHIARCDGGDPWF